MKEKKLRIVIEPGKLERRYWQDLWRFRELLFTLTWRDLRVRYRQTLIGVAWAVLRPILTLGVLWLVFSRFVGAGSEEQVPYPILVFAGLLPWTFFATALGEAGNSLTVNERLVTKIYFPRLLIPLSAIITSFVDFLIALLLLGLLMGLYAYPPTWRILWLPAFLVLVFLAALGTGLLVAALNVQYRDFRYVVPFVVQFGLYLSPVAYSIERVPEAYRALFSLNPIVGIIDGFRWCITGRGVILLQTPFFISLGVILLLLVLGIRQFRRMERTFADII